MSEQGASPPKPETTATQGDPSIKQDSLVGTLFDQRYQILAQYGAGATGTAYKAHDNLLDRDVAVKIIHAYLLTNERAIERFKAEAATSTAMSHPNIAQVYSQGIASDGRLYLVMDCLEGQSLAELLEKNGKLDLNDFFSIFSQVIDALKYAHEQGIIHRDVKPNNIMLIDEGSTRKAYLLDFGIAKCIDQNSEQGSTQTGAMIGSSAYMSPEQCTGSQIDFRADIYSLACVMLESLIGESPFKGQSALDIMYQHLNESLTKLGFLNDLPEQISAMLRKCLQKNPDMRYKNMTELQNEFLSYRELKDTLQRKWSAKKVKKESPTKTVLTTVAGFIMLAGLVYLAVQIRTSSIETGKKHADAALKPNEIDVEKIPLPPNFGDTLTISKDWNVNSRIQLYNRWLRKKASQAPASQQAYAHQSLIPLYLATQEQKKAQEQASAIKSLAQDLTPTTLFNDPKPNVLLSCLLKAYLQIGKPLEGIQITDAVLKRCPTIMNKWDNQYEILSAKGFNYESAGKYSEALDCLLKAEKEAKSGDARIEQNETRGMLITVLCLLGRVDESKAVAQECESLSKKRDKGKYLADQYRKIGDAYFKGKQFKISNQWLEKSIKEARSAGNNPIFLLASNTMIANYRALEQYDSAATLDKELLKMRKTWFEKLCGYRDLASDSQRTKDSQQSADYAAKAVDIAKNNLRSAETKEASRQMEIASAATVYRDLLNARDQRDNAKKMLDEFSRQVERELPGSLLLANLYKINAQLCLWQRDGDSAMVLIEKAHDIARKNKQLGRYFLAELDYLTADAMGVANRQEEKIKYAESGLKELENQPPNANLMMNLWIQIAEALQAQNKKEDSARYCKKVMNVLSSGQKMDYLDQFRQLAQLHYYALDYVDSEKVCKTAIQAATENGYGSSDSVRMLQHCLQDALNAEEKYAEAITAGEKAAEIARHLNINDSTFHTTLLSMSVSYQHLNQLNKSLECLKEYLEVCPEDQKGNGYVALALHSKKAGNMQDYKRILEQGLEELNKENMGDIFSRATIELELHSSAYTEGKAKEAEEHLQRAYRLADRLPRDNHTHLAAYVYKSLARQLLEQKRYAEAEKCCQTSELLYQGNGIYLYDRKQNLSQWEEACRANGDLKHAEEIKKELATLP